MFDRTTSCVYRSIIGLTEITVRSFFIRIVVAKFALSGANFLSYARRRLRNFGDAALFGRTKIVGWRVNSKGIEQSGWQFRDEVPRGKVSRFSREGIKRSRNNYLWISYISRRVGGAALKTARFDPRVSRDGAVPRRDIKTVPRVRVLQAVARTTQVSWIRRWAEVARVERQPQEVEVLPAMEVVAAAAGRVAGWVAAATARADHPRSSSSSRVAKGALSAASPVGTSVSCSFTSRTRTKRPVPSTSTISTPSSPKWWVIAMTRQGHALRREGDAGGGRAPCLAVASRARTYRLYPRKSGSQLFVERRPFFIPRRARARDFRRGSGGGSRMPVGRMTGRAALFLRRCFIFIFIFLITFFPTDVGRIATREVTSGGCETHAKQRIQFAIYEVNK